MGEMLGETMGAALVDTLPDDALTAALDRQLAEAGVDPGPYLEAGEFRLSDSPSFGRDVADSFAQLTGLPRWDEFRRLFAMRDIPKPAKPSPDYIEAEARAIERDPARLPMQSPWSPTAWAKFTSLNSPTMKRNAKNATTSNRITKTLTWAIYVFVCGKSAGSQLFFDRFWRLPISEESRKRHTYITGGAGSGKSEVLKAIMYHYLARHTFPALVLIDPHGDVAEQVAHWPELSDGKRLVYIDPALSPGMTPVFNPLDIPDDERNHDDIAIVVKQLIEVFPELIDGLEFTAQMRTLIAACLTVLLHVPGSTLADLMDFMDDSKNARWQEIAAEVLGDSLYRDFFRREFPDKTMDITKRGIRMRLYEALQGNPAFFRMIVGKSTFNLEELLNRRAVVIFRLGRGDIGETTSNLIGKFIMARLKAFAFKQGRIPEADRIPVHVFVDECQNYLSESVEIILKEARKYGVHLTLAQQILGDGMSPDLLKAILGNTAVKITGKNALHTLKKIADETGADLDELQALSTGYFHIKAGSRKGVVVRMPSHRVKDKGTVKPEAWAQLKDSQVARFYRTATTGRPTSLAPARQRYPID